jgi:hypothetical protein
MHARRWLPWFIAFVAGIALLNSLAALQDYQRGGGTRAWEPFLWEFSSALLMGPLSLAVGWAVGRWRLGWWLLPGFLVFTLLHVAGMFGIRFAVYGLAGVGYDAGPLGELLRYEGAKDLISFAIALLLGRGYWLWREGQAREAELQRTRSELAEARLARLAEQVQPHFLFNTLNLIAATVHEDAERADALLCQLAELLRQTTAAQQVGEHALADELALVQPFLALMQARFGAQRLQVEIDASEAARAVRLPALLLLGPVENAIKHDVAAHRGPVRVQLRASVDAGRLRIELLNSGAQAQPDAPEGSGLRNLRERLMARYGTAARLHFEPFEGGMRLALEIPA